MKPTTLAKDRNGDTRMMFFRECGKCGKRMGLHNIIGYAMSGGIVRYKFLCECGYTLYLETMLPPIKRYSWDRLQKEQF